jgi:hypothetical protein
VKSALVCRWTGAPQRVGLALPWRRERLAGLAYTATLPGSRHHRHVVASNLELLRAIGAAPPAALPRPDGRWLLERIGEGPSPVAGRPPSVVLLPGAGRADKLLPVEGLDAGTVGVARATVRWCGPGEHERAPSSSPRRGGHLRLPPTWAGPGAGRGVAVVGATPARSTSRQAPGAGAGCFTTTDWQRNGPLVPREVVPASESTAAPARSAWPARA